MDKENKENKKNYIFITTLRFIHILYNKSIKYKKAIYKNLIVL